MLTLAAILMVSGAFADEMVSGTVKMESESVAIGVGVSWGDGTLSYKGKEYKFKVDGLSLVDLGFSKVQAEGDVYNLKDPQDLGGTYGAVAAAYAAGKKGKSQMRVRNTKGVEINLHAKEEGARLALAGGGISITMK